MNISNMPPPAQSLPSTGQRIPSPPLPSKRVLKQVSSRSETESQKYQRPSKRITHAHDIDFLLESEAFERLFGFIVYLNHCVRSKKISQCHQAKPENRTGVISGLVGVLDQLSAWIDQVPPSEQPQRYGNKSFRIWMERLETESEQVLKSQLPETIQPALVELLAYFVNGFGNATRIDYGSGHELNFVAFLCCLDLLGIFAADETNYEALILVVFNRYLEVVRKLQTVYKLEPAGSHGVWGLDDYQFLSYLWGSSQLIDHPHMKPKSITNNQIVSAYQKEYIYLSSIDFVHQVKSGPFHEHSPLLYDISGVPHWEKVNKGLIKMFIGEVIKKVPVVQHFEFGTLLPWRQRDTDA